MTVVPGYINKIVLEHNIAFCALSIKVIVMLG